MIKMFRRLLALIVCAFVILFASCSKRENKLQETIASHVDESTLSKNANEKNTVFFSDNDPYASVINERVSSLSEEALSSRHYALYDIDGNGSEELLIGSKTILWGYESGFSNQTPVENIVLDQLYTTIDQKVQEIIYQPTWRWNNYFAESLGGRDILSNGIIRYYGGTPDYISYAYFRYSNGDLEFIKALMSYEIAGTWAVVDNQGNDLREKISKDEFECIKSEIEDGAEVVKLDWKPLIEYGK